MHSFEGLAQFAGVSLVAGIWQGMALAAAVWFCLRLVPKSSAALRFAAWSLVFGVVALLPFVENLRRGSVVQSPGAPVFALDPRWSFAVGALWLVFSAFRAADLAVHGLRLWALARRAVSVGTNARYEALLATGRRKVLLCTSTEIDRPSVIGFVSPRILVPAWLMEQMTEYELTQVVLHEMEHLRRGDDWLNLLQKLSLVVMPLNPVLFWVERRLCFERELACDDGVLRRTKAPRAYATCLTSLAERGLDRRVLSLALGALERQSQLARRVHRILRREASLSPRQSRGLTGAVALVLIGCATGLARCPQLVTFSAPTQQVAAAHTAEAVSPISAARFVQARAERVMYPQQHFVKTREPQEARPMLMRASMALTEPVHRRVVPAKAAVIQRVHVRQAKRVPTTAPAWAMLTSWSDENGSPMATPVAFETTNFHPYAAVRVDGGWLIVQL